MDQNNLTNELTRLRLENQALKKRVLRDFMERAIRDEQMSRDFAARIQEYYPTPVTPWFICILFWGNKPSKSQTPLSAPLDTVSAAFSPVLQSFGQPFFLESQGTVVCLLNASMTDDPADSGPETGSAFCEAMRDVVAAEYDRCGAALGISHITISHAATLQHGPRFLYRSAVSVSEYRTAESPLVCLETGPHIPTQEDYGEALSLEPVFWRQIQQHSFFEAATTLDQLIQLTTLDQGSLERTLASVFSRMEIVLRSAIQENGGDALKDPEFSSLLPPLSEADSFWAMRQTCYDILATLEDRFYTLPNTRNRKMPAIEAYIQEHITEQSLSAASIAEAYKISPSYLSRIFKVDMEMGILDYIHRMRIDLVKKLLANTDLSINEVSAKAGFSNRWSMTRVFKDLEGMTPGEFRTITKPLPSGSSSQ